ncbi:class I SAM-dependent methyltransferase [Athalassotoga saccharophila]|uniref:class I SAM-dependent methyltransferase n=1 Tax=Athalassotoga saccharophila TaxID=1441386 RepID=UPI00137AA7C2|nr:methyltransferase [Athalassotoga saccharophila]BBJ28173.1 ribosomal RNA small subunit methyltransferase C [Athalassotoga saccharophila]
MFEHYYSQNPSSKIVEKDFEFNVGSQKLRFKTVSGVFSFGNPDPASVVLVRNFPEVKGDLLDLGCGYGFIGISLKAKNPDLNLFMSDINERAVEYAKINAKNNNIFAVIKSGDGFEIWNGMEFDFVVFNPPMAAGKDVWVRLIEESRSHLRERGLLFCVGFHNKGGSAIEREMKRVFGNVSTIVKDGGIRVYCSER